MKNNKHNSLHVAWKYARIFVPQSPQFSSTSQKTVHFHSCQNTARFNIYIYHLSIELWTDVNTSGSLEEQEMLREHAPLETSSKASNISLISTSVFIAQQKYRKHMAQCSFRNFRNEKRKTACSLWLSKRNFSLLTTPTARASSVFLSHEETRVRS